MGLSKREEVLVEAVRRLPPAAAEELTALAERLASLAHSSKLDWSDSWSDSDLEDYSAEAVRRLEEEERDPST